MVAAAALGPFRGWPAAPADALLQEFRARLISDVVPGKLDVRAAASGLPEITEIEPIDEPADGADLEEAVDELEAEEVAA